MGQDKVRGGCYTAHIDIVSLFFVLAWNKFGISSEESAYWGLGGQIQENVSLNTDH